MATAGSYSTKDESGKRAASLVGRCANYDILRIHVERTPMELEGETLGMVITSKPSLPKGFDGVCMEGSREGHTVVTSFGREGSPAEQAGAQAKDILCWFVDDKKVTERLVQLELLNSDQLKCHLATQVTLKQARYFYVARESLKTSHLPLKAATDAATPTSCSDTAAQAKQVETPEACPKASTMGSSVELDNGSRDRHQDDDEAADRPVAVPPAAASKVLSPLEASVSKAKVISSGSVTTLPPRSDTATQAKQVAAPEACPKASTMDSSGDLADEAAEVEDVESQKPQSRAADDTKSSTPSLVTPEAHGKGSRGKGLSGVARGDSLAVATTACRENDLTRKRKVPPEACGEGARGKGISGVATGDSMAVATAACRENDLTRKRKDVSQDATPARKNHKPSSDSDTERQVASASAAPASLVVPGAGDTDESMGGLSYTLLFTSSIKAVAVLGNLRNTFTCDDEQQNQPAEVARSNGQKTDFAEVGGIMAVYHAMDTHLDSEQLLQAALAVLSMLFVGGTVTAQKTMKWTGAIGPTLRSMEKHPSSGRTARCAFDLLDQWSLVPGLLREIGATENAVKILVACTRQHAQDDGLRGRAWQLLSRLAHAIAATKVSIVAAVSYAEVGAVADYFKERNPEFGQHCKTLLGLLCADADTAANNQATPNPESMLTRVVQSLLRSGTSEADIVQVLASLVSKMLDSSIRKRDFAAIGGVLVVMHVMKMHPDSVPVQAESLLVLSILAEGFARIKTIMIKTGVAVSTIYVIRGAMGKGASVPVADTASTLIHRAFRTLYCLSDHSEFAHSIGGARVSTIVDCMKRHLQDGTVQSSACVILSRLAHADAAMKDIIIKAGACMALIKVVEYFHGRDPAVEGRGRQLLKYLL